MARLGRPGLTDEKKQSFGSVGMTESDEVLSAPWIWDDLREEGGQCSRNRLARLMHTDKA